MYGVAKQDRTPVRTPAHIEQKYDLNKDFAEIEKAAINAQKTANAANFTANSASKLANDAKTAAGNAQARANDTYTVAQTLTDATKAMFELGVNAVPNDVFAAIKSMFDGIVGRLEALEGGGLPTGYTQLEYIQSSGTQYINTLFAPNQDTKLEVRFQTNQTTSGGIAACDTNWQSNGFGVWVNAGGYGNATTQNVAFYGEDPITAILDKNTLYKDGELIWTATVATFQTSFYLTLMALNRNGSPQEKLTGKIYYCKIWDNNILIRDFVPCINQDGAYGLYDKVTKQFYGNAGTGAFTGA